MERTDVIKTVNDFLTEEFEAEIEGISFDANFHETLDLDSLDYVDLVVLVEEAFKFKLQGDDFKSVISFNDLYDLIHSKVNERQLA